MSLSKIVARKSDAYASDSLASTGNSNGSVKPGRNAADDDGAGTAKRRTIGAGIQPVFRHFQNAKLLSQ